jgi:trans-aconitate methyltransferase
MSATAPSTATRSLAELVAASAEESVSLLLARSSLIGLPQKPSRALVFGCGSGHTAVAIADRFGGAVGFDPSGQLISDAELAHGSRADCEFAVGGISELTELTERFALVHADLSQRDLIKKTDVAHAVSAFLSVLAPGGIAAIGIPARRTVFRRAALGFAAVARGVAAAGGRVTWVSGHEDDTFWIFVRGRPPQLRLLPPVQHPIV